MKTYFVEIVFNNENKFAFHGTRYLRCIVTAHDNDEAAYKALVHYNSYYTGGDRGQFYVQCNWVVDVPTREIIEMHWKNAMRSVFPMAVNDPRSGKTIGYDYHQLDKNKAAVLETWDCCNSNWAYPSVYYEPKKGGYVVALHNHMSMPSEFMFFKGNTAETYKKAKKFVKDNTFKGDYYKEFNQ